MKNLTLKTKLIPVITLLCMDVTKVWAAGVAREDNSNLFVWIFLAFCAIIVVAQLLPAVIMMLGLAKSVKKETLQVAPSAIEQEVAKISVE